MNTLAFALLAFSLTEAVVDDFRYADVAAAASVWSVTPPAPALQLAEAEGRTTVQLAFLL